MTVSEKTQKMINSTYLASALLLEMLEREGFSAPEKAERAKQLCTMFGILLTTMEEEGLIKLPEPKALLDSAMEAIGGREATTRAAHFISDIAEVHDMGLSTMELGKIASESVRISGKPSKEEPENVSFFKMAATIAGNIALRSPEFHNGDVLALGLVGEDLRFVSILRGEDKDREKVLKENAEKTGCTSCLLASFATIAAVPMDKAKHMTPEELHKAATETEPELGVIVSMECFDTVLSVVFRGDKEKKVVAPVSPVSVSALDDPEIMLAKYMGIVPHPAPDGVKLN